MQGRTYQKYYFKITIFYKIKLICIKLKTILQKLNTNLFFEKSLSKKGLQNLWPMSWDQNKSIEKKFKDNHNTNF
jgi:hypothetical protein